MLAYTVNLSKEVAAITGGGGILCSTMAKALAECGAKVAVIDLRLDAAEQVAREIVAAGGTAIGVSCDVTAKPSMEQANAVIEAKLGPITILVNGAGGNSPKGTTGKEMITSEDLRAGGGSFFDLDPSGFEFVFKLNYAGTVLATQVFARSMVKNGSGCIINISSMSAFTPLTKVMSYSNAKSAVNSFTRWLAVHFGKTGVRVNAIAPGFLLTEQNRTLLTNADGSATARGDTIKKHTPMGRYGEPQELLGALLFLASREASGFVTGTVIPIDGGFSAFSGV